ncbi:MAG TPA: prolyl oligopeptidase family serine peptidase, partial [Candidatus Deferrimicrobium sp.]|nr:prolyl oligopeptidase family serine peptidase [Candidatus Deferrimicrobium sp.]
DMMLEPSPASHYLACSIYNGEDQENGLFVRDLRDPAAPGKAIHTDMDALYTNLAWSKTKSRLAYIYHHQKDEVNDKKTFSSSLWVWDGDHDNGKKYAAVPREKIAKGWMIPAENKLQWSEDGERLFFGFKPYDEYLRVLETAPNDGSSPITPDAQASDIYNIERILAKRGVDVWRWDDPTIIPQQKKEWEQFRKRIYTAVYHFSSKQFIHLTDKTVPGLQIPENPDVALSSSDRPYLKETTWDDSYKDYYLTYLISGFRSKILNRQQFEVSLSPRGEYVVYYNDKHWYLYDVRLKFPRRLTAVVETPFYDEDHDFPGAVPGYGIAGWTENDRSVLIYDKYDIWEFFTGSNVNRFTCLTEGLGRKNKLIFRVQKLDPEAKYFQSNEKLLLTAYADEEKYTAFYRGTVGKPGVEKLIRENKKFTFLKKAKKTDRLIYTREDFGEFPDIWVSDLSFKSPEQVTHVNPQRDEFLWGKSELVEWQSLDGTRLQGVVIKPENYDSRKRYPVLVYYYRFFTDKLYEFNEVVINHRPCFPFYAGHGYVIFLPDIRLQVGQPGNSAFGCIVPGVQKLIDMGIADAKAIALHGHSWSGYLTAFIITQTNMFAAAVAGAPVANMTSAYSGIRWQTGVARQFQYEKGQSRIGKSLWENAELYIENSPVFFAHRIETPLLIEVGDNDGAVPWYQGLELYLAMRRLGKNCILLEYNDEEHHLEKYPNKLDYTIKMKEYLDHYLKGAPAPDWISKGVPYRKIVP